MLAGMGLAVAAGMGLGFIGGLRPAEGGEVPKAATATIPTVTADDARITTVASFLNKHCVSCHNPDKHKADLTLHEYTSQPAIMRGRKTLLNALKMIHAGEMPPDTKPKPAVPETDAFFAAVDGIYSDADRSAKPDPGRVTVRRLNRTEYNNTVRDLLGVEVNAADDFPADDIGHGFDNIGDVLTVSPVLMERYLAAAENIAITAVPLETPKAESRRQGGKYLEPAGPKVPDLKFRPLPKGELNTPLHLGTDGDYVFKTRVYGESPDGIKPMVTLLQNGNEIATVEVTGTKKEPQAILLDVRLDPGDYRIALRLANPSDGAQELDIGQGGKRAAERAKNAGIKPEPPKPQDVRTVYVEYLALDGPADNRPGSQRRLLSYADPKSDHPDRIRQIAATFASRAYRRPATKDEAERLAKLVEEAEARGEKIEAGLQLMIQAVLVSPKFLFRLELDDKPDSPEPRPLDDYALASRLSYFLWASMPDKELTELASKNQLTANLETQVRRMLKDSKAKSLVDNFAMQWLQLKRLRTFMPDQTQFKTFDEQLRSSMAKETELFIGAIINEDRSILDFIDGDFTFLNERLAQHYGIADTNGNWLYQRPDRPAGNRIPYDGFVRVSLPPGGPRGGILTQASVLTVTSNPTRTSPVKRGKWVLEQILGTPPPPPPPNVPELDAKDGKTDTTASLRKRMEAHRENPACANCHAKMDPIGFAFENFNAVGAYRSKDGNFDIDATGVLPDGKSFKGAAELKVILKDKKELVSRALAEKLLIYALGRGLEYYDDRSVDKISKAVAEKQYKFSSLVTEIVKSDPFRMRRGLEKE